MTQRRRWPAAAYSLVQTLKLRHFEAKLLRTAHTTVAVSANDAASLRALVPEAHIEVAANGVDTLYFSPTPSIPEDDALLVFTGKMDFRPNVDAVTWFCAEVWPLVRRSRPEARFAIVGRDPAPRVRELAALPGVTVTGAVDDVRPWVAMAGVVVAPLRVGGGTRLKVLEAMAMAKALVATTMAVEGLDLDVGHEVALADAPGEMARRILALQGDPAARAAMGAAARRRAEFQYRWEQVGWKMEALIRQKHVDRASSA
jgi:glycosyltransferase involved in cell wall biosynthesis